MSQTLEALLLMLSPDVCLHSPYSYPQHQQLLSK